MEQEGVKVKKGKGISLWSVLIGILICLLAGVIIFCKGIIVPYNIQQVEEEFPWVETLKELDFDLFGYNRIVLSEWQINQLAIPMIKEEMEKVKLPAGTEIQEIYLRCTDKGIQVMANIQVGKVVTGVSTVVNIQIKEDEMTVQLKDGFIGNKAVPEGLLNSVIQDKKIVIRNRNFRLVEFNRISYHVGEVDALIKLNLDRIIQQFVPGPKQEGIKEVLTILGRSEEGQRFANEILDMLILDQLGVEIKLEKILKSISNFTDISVHDKMRLVLAINKLI